MESDKFCLRWNDFETNISSAFRELRDDKDFFDVTLACEDEQIQGHKVILSACSTFFRNIFRRNPHQHPLLYLKGVKYSDLQSVLNFMYHGEVNVSQEDLNSFLAVAEDLKIKGLTQNKTSTLAAGKLASSSTRNSPLLRSAPQNNQRDHNPPLKRSNTTHPHVPTTTDDTEIQEIIPVKSEPADTSTQQHAFGPQVLANNVLTADEDQLTTYQEEDYQYEEIGYEEHFVEASEIEVNKGHMEKNKDMDMDSLISDTGSGTMCLLCNKVLAYRHDARRHIRMKHSGSNSCVTCELCGKKSKHRWSHADHMRQQHGHYSKQKLIYM